MKFAATTTRSPPARRLRGLSHRADRPFAVEACSATRQRRRDRAGGSPSIEFKVNLLAPAEGERIIARGRVVRAGRTISVCAGDAFAVRDGRERHVSTMTATMMTVTGRENITG